MKIKLDSLDFIILSASELGKECDHFLKLPKDLKIKVGNKVQINHNSISIQKKTPKNMTPIKTYEY